MPKGWRGDTRGTEQIGPEDTFEGDRLLAQAHMRLTGNRKGVASLPPASCNQIVLWLSQIEALREVA